MESMALPCMNIPIMSPVNEGEEEEQGACKIGSCKGITISHEFLKTAKFKDKDYSFKGQQTCESTSFLANLHSAN